MANTTTSPNMNLPIPVVGADPGPDWANNVNACLNAIDSHNHSAGQGVPVTPSGLSINADLPMNGNNLTTARTVRFSAQGSPLSAAADVGCLYESGVDLYYNDGSGNQVRITQSGSVTGSSGTITGLPSGTASASYAGGTFTFQSATNTPATMAVGPLVIGSATASPKTVTLSASASQPANYDLTFPLASPAANQVPVSDGSGNLSWSLGLLPIGSVVATFPNLTGAYSTASTTTADAYGFVLCGGQTISDASSPMNGQVVPNINNSVFLQGSATAGTTGGSATSSATLAHTHAFTSSTSVANSSHVHSTTHYHQWGYESSSSSYSIFTPSTSYTTFTTTTPSFAFLAQQLDGASGSTRQNLEPFNTGPMYTGGALATPTGDGITAGTGTPQGVTTVSGTTNSTGSGSSFSILPPYISAVYLMRVK